MTTPQKVLFIFGTRPEAIKMAPVIKECLKHPDLLKPFVCITSQHKEMLQQVIQFFDIRPDFDLNIMKANQTLFDITATALTSIQTVLETVTPDVILVQGDTTTAMVGALAGYYKKIRVGHIEAGLRSRDIYAPYPEEVNRKIISTMATFHFAPTEMAMENLAKEGYHSNVFVTGNTVIDALLWGVEKIRASPEPLSLFREIDVKSRLILVTAHRRENFGQPLEAICRALVAISDQNEDVSIVYPVHLNPNVKDTVYRLLSNKRNIHLIEPVEYPQLLWLLDRCYLVLTDSGGIQEEAPALGKPVVVLRTVTERQEGVLGGTSVLVGTDTDKIIKTVQDLLDDRSVYDRMSQAINPYGDGTAAKKIVSILLKQN